MFMLLLKVKCLNLKCHDAVNYQRNRQTNQNVGQGLIRGVASMKRIKISIIIVAACLLMHIFCCPIQALEAGSFRLLSVSETEKLVLISRIPDQKKYLLDAADVKITINDNPGELKDLILFTIVQVQIDTGKKKRKGVNLDGSAREINVSDPAQN